MSHLAWYFFANAYVSLGRFGHLRVRSLVWEARAFALTSITYLMSMYVKKDLMYIGA